VRGIADDHQVIAPPARHRRKIVGIPASEDRIGGGDEIAERSFIPAK
jgi:hypothetical protein